MKLQADEHDPRDDRERVVPPRPTKPVEPASVDGFGHEPAAREQHGREDQPLVRVHERAPGLEDLGLGDANVRDESEEHAEREQLGRDDDPEEQPARRGRG
ncbi:MAG: hypothetical protein H6720_19140 [Sandaracinus sp.]|nr:hypothetical protein [Sandaracinus sp.]